MLVERLHQVRDHVTSLAAGRKHRDGPTEQVADRMQIALLVRRQAQAADSRDPARVESRATRESSDPSSRR